MAYKGRKAVDPHVVMAEAVNAKRITPNMMRVTLGGDGLAQFTPAGYDQWFRLFLPRAGQDMLRLPTRTSGLWYAEYLATPKARRPWVRNYTVRSARPDLNEIDVDFVLHAGAGDDSAQHGSAQHGSAHHGSAHHGSAHHGSAGRDAHGSGPGAGFAEAADRGMRVGVLDQGVAYNPRHAHDWTLLVADESGLPAVAGICESLPKDARGVAVVEVPTAGDRQEFRTPPGVELRWVVRSVDDSRRVPEWHTVSGSHAVPGQAALAELRGLDLTGYGSQVYAFAIGESSLATGARRHLVGERGIPRTHVDFVGYWRHGRPSPG